MNKYFGLFFCLPVVLTVAVMIVTPVRAVGDEKPKAANSVGSANTVISAKAGGSRIRITTTARLAGAIQSLTWQGKEFIDSHDHGRQLQSASNFDCGKRFIAETFNPTEAGSVFDGAGETSSSKLLFIRAKGNELITRNQMAFWLRPSGNSLGNPARNKTILSNHIVKKHVRIGYKKLTHVIQYAVTFTVPKGEPHTYAQFEAVTGYMPVAFKRFMVFDVGSGKLKSISVGPGEQSKPVVLATVDGKHAMGIYSPDQPSKGFSHAGYGRFEHKAAKVVKWNCVFRTPRGQAVKAGDYSFRNFVLVGDVEQVTGDMVKLHAMFPGQGK